MALKGLAERQQSAAPPAVDPENREWVDGAAENPSTVSNKKRKDRARVRIYVDVSPELKAMLEQIAGWEHGEDTSMSQVAEMLLTFGARAYQDGDRALQAAFHEGKTHARTPRFTWNVEIPEAWDDEIASFLVNGNNGGKDNSKV
jgi:hypothetical protein